MRGIGLQPGVAGAAVISSASFRDSARQCHGGLPSLCFCPAAILPKAKGYARTRGRENEARLPPCLRNPSYHMPPPLLSWASLPLKRREKQGALTCVATLEFEVTPAIVVVLSTVLGFVALRTYVYFRMEYIIAAMLARHVPQGGAKVVELNTRGGKNLYYYPADIAQVVAVTSTSNVQLLENQASRAGVRIQIKTQGPASLGVPSSSMDAVVSVFCLRDFPDREVCNILREAVRVLKPGKPFVFAETVKANNNFIGALLHLAGTKRVGDLLPYLQEVDLEVDCEEIFSLVDPHLVGIATKKLSAVRNPNTKARKGFKSSKPRQG